MCDRDLRAEVLACAGQLEGQLRLTYIPTAHYELVLDRVETKDKQIIWQYYYVDHENKTLFWLKPYPIRDLLCNVRGVEEPTHISG
jgi:hypothetical protein